MVKLVEYAESSDDALDNHSDDGSQWSSFGEIPSSPSDSFSYPMESLSSEEEDADDAPSRTSLDVSGSLTSSADTAYLNPDNDMDEELHEDDENCNFDNIDNQDDVKNVKNEKNDEIFSAWKDLQTAFEINAFKKRGVDTLNNVDEHKVQGKKTEKQQQVTQDDEVPIKSTLLNVETEKSSFPALFAPGIAERKTRRPCRRKSPTKTLPTGASPRLSTLFTEKQQQHTKDTAFLSMQYAEPSTEKHTKTLPLNGQTNETAFCLFQPSQVEPPTFSSAAKQTDAKTPDFIFGKPGAAVSGEPSDDTHMHRPNPKRTATAACFVPIEGGFTLGQSGKNSKPYKFYNFGKSGNQAVSFSAKTPNTTNDGDDACMRSPSAHDKLASQKPTTGRFLFGQAYKNRKPHAFSRQKSNESLNSTESVFTPIIAPPTGVSRVLWETNDPIGDTSSGSFGANSASTAASTFFSTGVTGPNVQHRNSGRRKKKGSSSSTFAPILESNSSRSQLFALSSTFGSSLSQSATATATRQQFNAMFAGGNAHESSERPSNVASAVSTNKSFITSTGGSFESGNSNAQTFSEAFSNTDSSLFRTDGSGLTSTSAAPAMSSAGVPGQVLRDKAISCNPFEFGSAETNMPTERANSHFPADNMSSASIGSFQIGSHDARKNPRVRLRRSGMFTHKNSPRKDAKIAATEPEPSPDVGSASSSTPSPFAMHHRRTRKNVRLRKCGRSPPTDQSAKCTFQCDWSSPPSDGQLHTHAVKPMATTGFGSTIEATSTSNSSFGSETTTQQQDHSSDPGVFSPHSQQATSSTSQLQNLNHPSIFQQNESSKSAQIQQTSTAGSRRILRAALRSVGVSGDRPRSAPPTMSNHDEGDAEMDSDDEQGWLELKHLGGVAYSSKRYEDAAKYYRQSIELLESLSDDETVMYTAEMRADKAKLHANRAASLMMLMQIAEAQRECRRSIEVDATYARAYLRLGRIQVLLGDAANAQANLDTARHLMERPDNKVSRSDEADYASLTKMEAKIKKLTTLQGEIKRYVDCGDFKQALVQTNVALILASNSRKLQVEKARILLRQKKFDQIIEFFTSIIEKQAKPGENFQSSERKRSKHEAA
ncbi:unnamed protein product [Peronospora destructor]|uniref:Uncharacterized protein n=1 Tax=Peronospora destructor TaxID=86335 RepID=A0AAV0SWY4_9STRA|nr:unnamed protein product [Peronospora destructor]